MRSTLEQCWSDQEVISMITLEGQSLLFFHLWRAWMQVRCTSAVLPPAFRVGVTAGVRPCLVFRLGC